MVANIHSVQDHFIYGFTNFFPGISYRSYVSSETIIPGYRSEERGKKSAATASVFTPYGYGTLSTFSSSYPSRISSFLLPNPSCCSTSGTTSTRVNVPTFMYEARMERERLCFYRRPNLPTITNSCKYPCKALIWLMNLKNRYRLFASYVASHRDIF